MERGWMANPTEANDIESDLEGWGGDSEPTFPFIRSKHGRLHMN